MNLIDLKERIKRHEGSRDAPYRDSLGLWTVGVGHLIDDHLIPEGCETIGDVLDAITDRNQHLIWLADDINQATSDAREWLGDTFDQLGDIKQQVIVEMAFQLGLTHLRGFKQMKLALDAHNVGLAADCGLGSKWAGQTPQRARELMDLLKG